MSSERVMTDTPSGSTGVVSLTLVRTFGNDPELDLIEVSTELARQIGPGLPAPLSVRALSGEGMATAAGVVITAHTPDALGDYLADHPHPAIQASQTLGGLVTVHLDADPRFVGRPATAVVSYRVREGAGAEFQRWQGQIAAAELRAQGFVNSEHHPPVPGVQEESMVIVRFSDQAMLDQWFGSADRQTIEAQGSQLIEDLSVRSIGPTWAGWFQAEGAKAVADRPPNWKQALSIFTVLYPLIMLLTIHLGSRLGRAGWPLWANILASNIVAVIALTWILMPQVTNLLNDWLTPPAEHTASQTMRTTIAILAAIAATVAVFAVTT